MEEADGSDRSDESDGADSGERGCETSWGSTRVCSSLTGDWSRMK